MLIDSHAHLEMKEFEPDRDAVVERAALAGVTDMVTVGTNLNLSRKAVLLAHRYPRIYATVGIHPHDVARARDEAFDEIKALAADPKVVAYGEIGLDYFRDLSPRATQVAMFDTQLQIARDLNLPVIIHDRDAHEPSVRMVRASGVRRGVFHCFSGDYEMAKQCLDMGFYISVPGVVTFDKSRTLHDVVRKVPLESLLLETDCPYLTPVPHRGSRNEPSYIVHTARKVAELKNVSLETVAAVTSANTRALFGLKPDALTGARTDRHESKAGADQ